MKSLETSILMLDGCTESEAEKHLKNGTIIFQQDDFEKNFESYMDEWGMGEEETKELERMIESKIPVNGWGIVEYQETKYYIMYVM